MPAAPAEAGSSVRRMPMNVKPIPTVDERINDIRMRTAAIVNEDILPNEAQALAAAAAARRRRRRAQGARRAARATIKEGVKKDGLWAPHLPQEYGGMGLDFLAHAYMNEVLAYGIGAGVAVRRRRARTPATRRSSSSTAPTSRSRSGCCRSSTGTMESGFSMTEPRQRRLRPALAQHHRRARRRRVGDQRPQVVHVERASPPTSSSSCAACRTTPASRPQRPDGADHRADRHARA